MRKKSLNLYFDSKTSSEDKFKEMKNYGFDEFHTRFYDQKETLAVKEQVEYAKKLGLNCTMIHCKYNEPPLNNFWLDNEVGEDVMNSYIDQIEQIAGLTKNFVIHLNSSKESTVSEIGLNRIRKMLEVCEKVDINLCIENLYSDEEIPYIFKYIKHPNLKICFDTGHQNFLTQNFWVFEEYGEYISVLHIHDNDGFSDMHDIPFTGTIDWKRFVSTLKNYPDLVLSVEILNKTMTYQESLKKIYNALCQLEKMENSAKKEA